jgi:site-specific DNA-cytosine methylase
MRYFSTFTGIGGFEIGIQNAYRVTTNVIQVVFEQIFNSLPSLMKEIR